MDRLAATGAVDSAFSRRTDLSADDYYGGLENLMRRGKVRDLDAIFNPRIVKAVRNGRALKSLLFSPDEADKVFEGHPTRPRDVNVRADWTRAENKSLLFPKHGKNREQSLSKHGLSVYNDDIFFDGYFRLAGQGRGENALHRDQPWLRWHPETKTYSLERGNAQEVLLEKWFRQKPGDSVEVYRGLREPQEPLFYALFSAWSRPAKRGDARLAALWKNAWSEWIHYLDAYSNLQSGGGFTTLSPREVAQFKARFQPAVDKIARRLEKLPSDPKARRALLAEAEALVREGEAKHRRTSIFFSADPGIANKFRAEHGRTVAEGRKLLPKVSLKIPKALLLEMSRNGEIYVGVEGDIEIGFGSDRAQGYAYENGRSQPGPPG